MSEYLVQGPGACGMAPVWLRYHQLRLLIIGAACRKEAGFHHPERHDNQFGYARI